MLDHVQEKLQQQFVSVAVLDREEQNQKIEGLQLVFVVGDH